MRTFRTILLLVLVTGSAAVTVLKGHKNSCPRQDLNCSVKFSNCMDPGWLKVHDYTPNAPEELQARVVTMTDGSGRQQAVLQAQWTIKDDGSISYLNATELHLLTISTGRNDCLRYSFKDKLSMRDQSWKKWSITSEVLVLQPGQDYKVSVFNIPKPEEGHSFYDVSTRVRVPDCGAAEMKNTQFCIETGERAGSQWQPNISMSPTADSSLLVSFTPDLNCYRYEVFVTCGREVQVAQVLQNGNQDLNASFLLSRWPRSCCEFNVQVKPICPLCQSDCPRRHQRGDFCGMVPMQKPDPPYPFAVVAGILSCIVLVAAGCCLFRKKGKAFPPEPPQNPDRERLEPLLHPPKVLVIYSQDHRLYRDVVLKLCAFLQAKCGTKVLVDLLDSTSVSMVGRVRWLEWQRQQLSNPSDKILVLCSRGVQAKWRAMCGQGRVTLREDVNSPTDDMLIPFLNLFLPDMHQAGMLGKYLVAYFEDVSSEEDVPSVFNLAAKYSLMKHFEELFFRLLDVEKYQPDRINHILGIGEDEYSSCPSGRALRDAIQTFKAFQQENPDWFQKECVESEEDAAVEVQQVWEQIPAVLECVPAIRDGPPVYACDVSVTEPRSSVLLLSPELEPQLPPAPVVELLPAVLHHHHQHHQVQLLPPHPPTPEVRIHQPVLDLQPPAGGTWLSPVERAVTQNPTEDDEDAPAPSFLTFPPSAVGSSIPEEHEDQLEPNRKGPRSGSDQGYSSCLTAL
ncbi:interleukin 17 receptor A1a isoform X2 [Oryzias melastigma]|uniref:interleukin 17 receptor A1a isoform X2 n=1 Tax=Oryzias melastigma TaxID=30732 RepID=UPI000CF83ED9|nr:interleukin 17 receptor A1a isoform X2 [Oryzias melastigma]